ncbi:SMI1/KNR4 family protein [Vibrio hyugaensis]|uniref:SMI1/KNR4 family protein n=1 Tax=Vibrio hyugaensis TaxID=1534743 RepID=UPI000CE3F6FB|nr:SMI1/KNR4 family protein [Vibrio hyugaensis]
MKFEDIKKGIQNEIPYPEELTLLVDWVESNGYPISGYFGLRPDDGDSMFYWFGFRDVESKLVQFGAGPDGSLYCIWDNDAGGYPIVHMGSEGGELKILASSFVDFLRLLAIGYDEIGFNDLSEPPVEDCSNVEFQTWVEGEFGVDIPSIGSAITEPAEAANPDFAKWVKDALDKYS